MIKDKFLKRIVIVKNECWIIPELCHKNDRERPTLWVDGKKEYGARAVYRWFKGSIPKRKLVRHNCDNGHCLNPNHLILGTYLDNRHDFMIRQPHLQKASIEKQSKSMLKYHANKTTKEEATRSKNISIATKKWSDSRTTKEKTKSEKKRQQTWSNKTPEELVVINKRKSESAKLSWAKRRAGRKL